MKKAELTPEQFYRSFTSFCGGKLNRAEDIERIVSHVYKAESFEPFEELLFEAKYITGLTKIIRNKENAFNDEYKDSLMKEFGGHIEKVKEKFMLAMNTAPQFINDIFRNKYFTLTQESLNELTGLCEDLGRMKSFLNGRKEGGKGF